MLPQRGSKDRPPARGDLRRQGRNGSSPRCRQMVGALGSAAKIQTGMAWQTPPNPSHRQRGELPERELGGFPPLASRERARGAARSKLLRTPELACARHVPGTIWYNECQKCHFWQPSVAEAITRAGSWCCRRERARATAEDRLRLLRVPMTTLRVCGALQQAAKLAEDGKTMTTT